MKHVIIVGAGFAGLNLAKKLNNNASFKVTLIDRFNFHQFQPLFYQVATAGLDASNISFPLRKIFQNSANVQVVLATLKEVQPEAKQIITDAGTFAYDYLVMATGCATNFFGNEQLETYAYPMKSTVEALSIRHSIVENLELAARATNNEERERLLNIVIVGAGPTGVELSGTLAEMKKNILPKDFPELDFSKMNIYLLEGGPDTLPTMSEKSRKKSRLYLEDLGVHVCTHTVVSDYDGEKVLLQDGRVIQTAFVIWAAGVSANTPQGIPVEMRAKGNRIKVDRYNKVQGLENIFAIGDVAYMQSPNYPDGQPQVCNVAIKHAETLAYNLVQWEKDSGKEKEFEYKDPGTMATIGRNRAVVDNFPFSGAHFAGFAAWVSWMGFHLLQLLGVKNKTQVFINWVYQYFTYDQNLRLIFKNSYQPKRKKREAEGVHQS
ncbi:MAG TPA: NAD(P)/FAD-dependent oxidoreductase [Flavisolibacter sp.]|jgi:NADH dehydrogenase|nr:NAD(P)/FAD-dependent oxidoreductase [Flavisolibacter sp.]